MFWQQRSQFCLFNCFLAFLALSANALWGQSSNVAPILTATGNQIYCPGTPQKIVTSFTITDPDDTAIEAMYIQISTGYNLGEDILTLTGNHPTIISSWDSATGILTLSGITTPPTYAAFTAAILDIVFSTTAQNPSGIKTFSITIGQANFLPSNGHYYQYIPSQGITWNDAKNQAASQTYYGLQGYLATITALDEAQLAGEQAAGTGWIGGSDEQTEGVWRWMTGPETGQIFWNGGINGSSPNFANWNTGEPNNAGNEDYAHITAPGIGFTGSWNDLSVTGDFSGPYQPQGFIVEYGGTPGDPVLQIATSTTLSFPTLFTASAASSCGPASFTLLAEATFSEILWYNAPTGGNLLATGNTFTTPLLSESTTYYVSIYPQSCTTAPRVPFPITIFNIPTLTIQAENLSICEGQSATITASSTAGTINWYNAPVGGDLLGTGTTFTTPSLSQTTTFFAEVTNNDCINPNRTPVEITVFPLPNVTNETGTICQNSTLLLDAGVEEATYLWNTGEETKTITIDAALPTYEVVITTPPPANCSVVKTFTITTITPPVITEIVLNQNIVTVVIEGIGNYEYSLNNQDFQSSNQFFLEEGGVYTLYVRDTSFCDFLVSEQFAFISVPKFFTPNGDGHNDALVLKGLTQYPEATFTIYNRFGQLIKQFSTPDDDWDGTFQGNSLPADDYWYLLQLESQKPIQKGHFSLKR